MLPIGSDTVVTLKGLYDVVGESFVSTATLAFTVKGAEGSQVTGLTNVAMPCVSGTQGTYRGLAPAAATAALSEADYFVEVHATTTGGNILVDRLAQRAAYYAN